MKSANHSVIIACLLACCLCLGVSSARAAATIGPKLQVELDAASATDVIPVIIMLSDKVNLRQFKDKNLSVRRSIRRKNLITALKSKAAQSQKGLEGFLRARGASEITQLWLINALAVRLPASSIKVVENLPYIESIRLDAAVSAPVMAVSLPALSIDDVSTDEAAGNVVFTVTRTGDTGPIILVDYASVDGSATAGDDYTAVMGQLTFLAGVTSQFITVPILEDTLDEGSETYTVTLSNAFNASLADDTGIATISDNDMPVLSIDDVGVLETAGNAVFTVTRAGDTNPVVTVDYSSANDSAVAGADYTAVSGPLTFLAGETSHTITVPILDDAQVEADETFTVTLSSVEGATVADAIGLATIFGNQSPTGSTFWNLNEIRVPEMWALGHIGQGIVVANMDSGVDINHPDLAPRWRGGNNSWFDVHGQHPVTPFDGAGGATGHGTKSMGLMVAGDASGFALGVAPGAKWIAVKVWDDAGNAHISDFSLGFQWLLDPDGNSSTDDAADVINNSWGFEEEAGSCNPVFQANLQALQAAGIAVVFSAGNSGAQGAGSDLSPANNPDAYAVGAVDNTLSVSSFSSRGPSACDGALFPQLVAPGEQVWTTDISAAGAPSMTQASGTSFASPHVAGAMAVLLSAFPDAGVTDLRSTLVQSARDLGPPGPDNDYGNGLIDLLAAYNYLLSCPPGSLDSDADGIPDACDNCINAANGPLITDAGGNVQWDTDGDGYGNSCDADLNQSGSVNAADLALFKSVFFTADADADLNGDSIVNAADLALFKSMFFREPGPSFCGSPLP